MKKVLLAMLLLFGLSACAGVQGKISDISKFKKEEAINAYELAKSHNDTGGMKCWKAVSDNSIDMSNYTVDGKIGVFTAIELARLTDPGLNENLRTINEECASVILHAQNRFLKFIPFLR